MALVLQKPFSLDISRLQCKQYHQGGLSPEASSLPDKFPTAVTTNQLWNGSGVTDEGQYTYLLTKDEIFEIEEALAAFKALELDGELVTKETFYLPTLQYVLRALCNEVHNGKGFFVLRGLEPDQYSVEDGMVIFLGIQSHIAEQRARQDDRGNMAIHIISDSSTTSSAAKDLHARHSKKSISFHTEETGDIIAWQTRNTAASGGSCIISSLHTIYNALATTRPDIIRILAEPDWPFALPNFHRRPLLFYHDSHLIINFCRAALLGSPAHPRPSHLPTLTTQQREALDVFEAVARGVELKIKTRKGDLHFINNLTVLHRRNEFFDEGDELGSPEANKNMEGKGDAGGEGTSSSWGGDKKKKKRHLVRMRIRNQEMGWELPRELQGDWDKAFVGEGETYYHVEPMPDGFFPLRMYPL